MRSRAVAHSSVAFPRGDVREGLSESQAVHFSRWNAETLGDLLGAPSLGFVERRKDDIEDARSFAFHAFWFTGSITAFG